MWPCHIPMGQHYVKNKRFFRFTSVKPCVSNYFYPRNPNPAASVLTLPEMFPSSHWSCFLVPFHSQLSHASSQEPPVTHIIWNIQKISLFSLIDTAVLWVPCLPPPFSEALSLTILLLQCKLLLLHPHFPLYNLLLCFWVYLCFHGSRKQKEDSSLPSHLCKMPPSGLWLSLPDSSCRSSGRFSTKLCQKGVGRLSPKNSSPLCGHFLWPSSP